MIHECRFGKGEYHFEWLRTDGDLLKYNVCNTKPSYVFCTDIICIDIRVTQRRPLFLKCICCSWAHHQRDVPYSQHLRSQLRSLVYSQLLFWFELLSLTDTFNDHIGLALLFAFEWAGVCALSLS